MGVPRNRWSTRENPIKLDDKYGYPYFRNPPNAPLAAGWFQRILKQKQCNTEGPTNAMLVPWRQRQLCAEEHFLEIRTADRADPGMMDVHGSSRSISDFTEGLAK